MCRNVNTYFAFSFGGNADFGESQFVNTSLTIDFPEEKEIGYGMAFRNDVDVRFDLYEKVKAVFFVSHPLTMKIEYAGGNIVPETLSLVKGENVIEFDLPKTHFSEMKFFVERRLNKNLPQTEIKLESILFS